VKNFMLLAAFAVLLPSLAGCSRGAGALPTSYRSDFIKLNGILYAPAYPTDHVPIREQGLTLYDTIKRKRSNVYRDGDASALAAGTPVYAIDDYAPSFRLAVKQGEELIVYQAQRNPSATRAGDMLDIGGRVKRIGIRLPDERFETSSITDQVQINRLVGLILESPYGREAIVHTGVKSVFLTFDLLDGTSIVHIFWLDSSVLGANIQLPQEFGAEIWEAIIAQREAG
jgi:hypothetical protein